MLSAKQGQGPVAYSTQRYKNSLAKAKRVRATLSGIAGHTPQAICRGRINLSQMSPRTSKGIGSTRTHGTPVNTSTNDVLAVPEMLACPININNMTGYIAIGLHKVSFRDSDRQLTAFRLTPMPLRLTIIVRGDCLQSPRVHTRSNAAKQLQTKKTWDARSSCSAIMVLAMTSYQPLHHRRRTCSPGLDRPCILLETWAKLLAGTVNADLL